MSEYFITKYIECRCEPVLVTRLCLESMGTLRNFWKVRDTKPEILSPTYDPKSPTHRPALTRRTFWAIEIRSSLQ